MTALYTDIVIRLHADAALAVSSLLRAHAPGEPPIAPGEIVAERRDDGRWLAHVTRPSAGWISAISGDLRDSEVEALCSLIESADEQTEDADGFVRSHMYLLGEIETGRSALAIYRDVTETVVRGLLGGPITAVVEALGRLDGEAEVSGLAAEIAALRALRDARKEVGS